MDPQNHQKIDAGKLIVPLTVLFLIGFVIYAFNLNNPLFWDDDDWIVNNPFVHSFSWHNFKKIFATDILHGFGLNSNYYRPFLLLTFTFNYVIGGIKPFGYHLLSNLIHIGNAVLIFYIFFLVTRKKLVAFLTAFFFLVHPLQTEAVTYISGRGDPLSVFFMLPALWFFIKTNLVSSQDTRSKMFRSSTSKHTSKHWVWMTGSLSLMVLALLSRETAIIFPVLLMVFYVSFLSKERFLKSIAHSFLKALPYWIISLVYLLLRLTVLNFKDTLNFYSEANVYTQHLSYRLFTFGHVLVDYFRLLFVPTGLHMERNMTVHTSLFQWPVWLSSLIILGLIFLLVYLYRKEKTAVLNPNVKIQMLNQAQNPKSKNYIWNLNFGICYFRVWFFGIGWFFITLAPASGIVPINALIYEHWLYLPMVGFWFVVAFYLDKFFGFLKSKNSIFYFLLFIFLVGYLIFFGVQSIKRNILWGKPVQFYEDILKYNPASVRVLNNLGNLYADSGQLEKAAEAYQRAISNPDGKSFPQPYYNLGNIFRDLGKLDRAEEEYKKAIEIDPGFPFAYENLAAIYAKQGDWSNAALMLEKVKELKPQEPRVYYNLGLIYFAWGKEDLARENLNLALKLSLDNPRAGAEIKRILEKLPQN